MNDLRILITGASRGLGLALARQCLAQGATVFAATRGPDNPPLDEWTTQAGDRLIHIQMDVARTEAVEAAVRQIATHTDRLDWVINNAGMHPPDSREPLATVSPDHCLETFNVNTVGPLRVAKACLPLLTRAASPLLANISSEAGSSGGSRRDREYAYCMSKAALNMQSVLLSNHLRDQGVRVHAIHPGWIRTDMGGPRAPLAPDEAATVLIATLAGIDPTDDLPVFIDYQGRAMPY